MSNDAYDMLVVVGIVLLLAFLFEGDPDVWDMLHQMAVGQCR